MIFTDPSVNHVVDSELFPFFVASGYDLTYFDEPLYMTDGIWLNPDGSIEIEDDAEDSILINENYLRKKKGEEDLEDLSDEELFSENHTGRVLLAEFNEAPRLDLMCLSNSINLALVNLLDTLPSEHISETDLLSAAIDSGSFASKNVQIEFSENNDLPSEAEILSLMAEDSNFAEVMTLNALGYTTTNNLKQSLISVKNFLDRNEPVSFSEIVHTVKVATNLQKRDLAKASIRLTLGEVTYNNLVDASVLSYLSYR